MLYQPLTKVGPGGGKVLVPAHRTTEAPKHVSPARLQSRPRAAQTEGAKNRQPPPKPRLARFPRIENESSEVIGCHLWWVFDFRSLVTGVGRATRLPSGPGVGRASPRAVFMVVGTAALRRPFPEPALSGGRDGRAAPSVPRARLIRWSGPRAARSSASSLASGGGDERRKRFPPQPGRVPGWPEW